MLWGSGYDWAQKYYISSLADDMPIMLLGEEDKVVSVNWGTSLNNNYDEIKSTMKFHIDNYKKLVESPFTKGLFK